MIIDPVSIWYCSHLILQSASLRWRRLQRCADIPIKAIWGSSITKKNIWFLANQKLLLFFITRISNRFLAFKKLNFIGFSIIKIIGAAEWNFEQNFTCGNVCFYLTRWYGAQICACRHPPFKQAVNRTSKSCQKSVRHSYWQ